MKLSGTNTFNEPNQQKTNGTSSQRLSKISYNYVNTLSRPRILQIKKEGELMVLFLKNENVLLKSLLYRALHLRNSRMFGNLSERLIL